MRDAPVDPACDLGPDGAVSNSEAFFCVELDNSDGDGSGNDNALEIGLSAQPGWSPARSTPTTTETERRT
jgi:hypothetical protein